MNKKQELDVVIKAFYYYLDEDSKKKCKTLLERMKRLRMRALLRSVRSSMIFCWKKRPAISMIWRNS